jgi:hypothetical protein
MCNEDCTIAAVKSSTIHMYHISYSISSCVYTRSNVDLGNANIL